MKKTILVTILVVAMLLATIGSVNAASVTPENVTVKTGETVTVTVKPEKTGEGIQFNVEFDATALKFEGATSSKGVTVKPGNGVANGNGVILAADLAGEGNVPESVVMTFTALKDIEATEVKVTDFVSGDEEVAEAGKVTVKVEKVDDTKDPDKKPDDTKKPDNTTKPTDINGKPIEEQPQMGAPIYMVAIAVIVIAAGAVLAVRKNK